MNQGTAPVPRETIDYIVSELERLMNDAGARWMLPKSDNKARFEGWPGGNWPTARSCGCSRMLGSRRSMRRGNNERSANAGLTDGSGPLAF
jgi:hypothetical protein